MFGRIKDNWKKSEAAVVIQNLLEHQHANLMFAGAPAQTANSLVGDAWDAKPRLMSGQCGPRPHKLAIAAYALYRAASTEASDSADRSSFMYALGQILIEIRENARMYPFTRTDENLLGLVAESFEQLASDLPHL